MKLNGEFEHPSEVTVQRREFTQEEQQLSSTKVHGGESFTDLSEQ
jgi:hypothetical protein